MGFRGRMCGWVRVSRWGRCARARRRGSSRQWPGRAMRYRREALAGGLDLLGGVVRVTLTARDSLARWQDTAGKDCGQGTS